MVGGRVGGDIVSERLLSERLGQIPLEPGGPQPPSVGATGAGHHRSSGSSRHHRTARLSAAAHAVAAAAAAAPGARYHGECSMQAD